MGTGSNRAPIAPANSGSDAKHFAGSQGSELGQVVTSQPEPSRVTGVEQEDHHAASDPPHLAQTGDRILPVMNGANRHRGVEGLVVERQAFGRSGQARRRGRQAVRAHERRRLHCEDVAVRRLVRPGASPDVQYGPGIAERCPDLRSDARFSTPGRGVRGSDGVVQRRTGHGPCPSGRTSGHRSGSESRESGTWPSGQWRRRRPGGQWWRRRRPGGQWRWRRRPGGPRRRREA